MVFKDNFTELHLLFSEPVHFTLFEDDGYTIIDEFDLHVPTFGLFYFDVNFRNFVGLINTPISDLQEKFPFVVGFKSCYQLLDGLLILKQKNLRQYIDNIIKSLNRLGINVSISGDDYEQIYLNGHKLTEQLFERICAIVLMALALKKESDFLDDPVMREMQEKINRIKNNNKPLKSGDSGNFKDVFMILTYEFGYKPNEIYNMTQYAINFITSYTGKSIRYKTTLIAAGNGNTKKVKFITDKGK